MATRFYFGADASDISPTFGTGGSTWNTSAATRYAMVTTKGVSVVAQGSTIGGMSGASLSTALDRQYVSAPLAAQTIPGTTTAAGQLMFRENNLNNNLDIPMIYLYRYRPSDSSTETLIAPSFYGSVLEFTTSSTHVNRILSLSATYDFATYGGGGGDYFLLDGDRLVLEIGASTLGGSTSPGTFPPSFTAKWGEDATDLPAGDETQTTDGAGWFEIEGMTLAFLSTDAPLDPFGAAGFFGA